ncbi:MAG TPA: DNA mismatch endonuclease Vsr [Rectinema sp.]|nr:DNA mismatch endonuclease Vsr [Rectinema sp.]
MSDVLSQVQRHNNMSQIKSRDTKPEKKVRQSLFSSGFRFRVNVKTLPGTPDIVLPKYRTVIFVNGCFWHGHKGCKYYTVPETNVEFWVDKVRKNKERDALNNQRLESLSWSIITIWECELKSKVFDATIERVVSELQQNKVKWEQYQQRRRTDREFSRAEAKRKRLIREEVEKELQEKFHIPVKVRKASHEEYE